MRVFYQAANASEECCVVLSLGYELGDTQRGGKSHLGLYSGRVCRGLRKTHGRPQRP